LRDSYQPKFRNIKWRKSTADFKKWCDGQTGFPVVDACMRQLNATGYMHNRGRMIVANFIVKTLLLDWHLGETYFAQKLTDYDPASNNGNWQGISGTGVDMKPYYRDMNPWIQSIKFDYRAEFIKRWVPELAEVDAGDIHRWHTSCDYEKNRGIKYPRPMVDYDAQKQAMLQMYKNAH
jgi:deoxyribodipyrimidine photo-lyase